MKKTVKKLPKHQQLPENHENKQFCQKSTNFQLMFFSRPFFRGKSGDSWKEIKEKSKNIEFSDPPGPYWVISLCGFLRYCAHVRTHGRTDIINKTNDHLWLLGLVGQNRSRILNSFPLKRLSNPRGHVMIIMSILAAKFQQTVYFIVFQVYV